MTCEEMNVMLDRLMDDELTEDERRAMTAHAAECADCAGALRATLQMKALFGEMEPEVDVPLAAQAKWRGAIRQEAARTKRRRLTRWIGSAAAAVAVLVGVGLAVNGGLSPRDAATQVKVTEVQESAVEAEEAAPPEVGVIEADGDTAILAVPEAALEAEAAYDSVPLATNAPVFSDEANAAEGSEPLRLGEAMMEGEALATEQAPAMEFAIQAEDVEDACQIIGDLAQEFDGTADVQSVEGGSANVYVELDAREAASFLEAVAKLDASENAPALPDVPEEGALLVLLVVNPVE